MIQRSVNGRREIGVERPKVVFFFPAIGYSGGLEKSLISISHCLVEDGFEVVIFYLESRGDVLLLIDPRVRIHQLRLPFRNFLFDHRFLTAMAIQWGWLRFLSSEKPRCVVGFQSSSVAIFAARLSGTPFIHRESADCRMALARRSGIIGPAIVRFAKRATYRFCGAIITNSTGSADSVRAVTRIPASRIRVIYNPLEADKARLLSLEKVDPEKWFWDGAPVVMAMGRLSPEKNHKELLKAVKMLTEHMEVRLVIAGEGSERAALEHEIGSSGLTNQVKLIGHLSNPYPYLRMASVFALPSLFEGLPNCLLEAAALGVPSVAYDCPSGPREILIDGKAGMLVPAGDVRGMAEAIEILLKDKVLANTLVEQAERGLVRFGPKTGADYGVVIREVIRSTEKGRERVA